MQKRLCLLSLIVVVLGALILSSCAKEEPSTSPAPVPEPAPAVEKPIELKLSTWVPPKSLAAELIDAWIEEVKEATGGKVNITHYASASLGAQQDHYNMVLSRQADIVLSGGTEGIHLRSEFVTLPFLFNTTQEAGYVQWKVAQKYMVDTELKDVKYLYSIPVALDNIAVNKQQIKSLEDMKGLKITTGGDIATKALEALGATPVFLPPPDMYTAIERGMVDGLAGNWEKLFIFKEYEVTKYRTGNINAWAMVMPIYMNLDAWNSIPSDLQEVIDGLSGLERSQHNGAIMDDTDRMFRGMIEEYDKEVGNPPFYDLTNEERDRWIAITESVRQDWVKDKEAKGIPAQEILDMTYALVKEYESK